MKPPAAAATSARVASAIGLLLRHRRAAAMAFDACLTVVANYAAFVLRFDGSIPPLEMGAWLSTLPVLVLVRALVFVPLGVYAGLWRYTSLWDLQRIVVGVATSTALFSGILRVGMDGYGYPRGVFVIDSLLLVVLMAGSRLARRVYRVARQLQYRKRVLIFGAGDAGEMIVRDMRNNPFYGFVPVGFLDDDPTKAGRRIHGVPVLGTRADLPRVMAHAEPDEILVAIPSMESRTLRETLRALGALKIRVSTLPSLRDLVNGTVAVSQIRPIAIQDLLPRLPIGLDDAPVRALIEGKRVLVTGAGGSIGSELCRQVAGYSPESLALVERHENSLFEIATDLADRGHGTVTRSYVADITDRARVRWVLDECRPHIVFHAAAHKHVPMMELNPCEAVKNNVGGTRVLIDEAGRFGVERFVLISTDKAVNPTSVMGATKRVAELCVQAMVGSNGTRYCAVRFGNVLASNGSVVPRFLAQIRAGGPVTVTDPEMRRYFILIPEAVQLVQHAAAQAVPGAVYVLEMGEQVKVADLARSLIRVAGYVPDEEIKIQYVGARPGEKLHEELVDLDEEVEPSRVDKILRVRLRRQHTSAELVAMVEELERLAALGDDHAVLRHIGKIVPTFSPARTTPADAASFFPTAKQAPSTLPMPRVEFVLEQASNPCQLPAIATR